MPPIGEESSGFRRSAIRCHIRHRMRKGRKGVTQRRSAARTDRPGDTVHTRGPNDRRSENDRTWSLIDQSWRLQPAQGAAALAVASIAVGEDALIHSCDADAVARPRPGVAALGCQLTARSIGHVIVRWGGWRINHFACLTGTRRGVRRHRARSDGAASAGMWLSRNRFRRLLPRRRR